MIVARNKEAFM